MARIRTIKPEFFRHEGLQDLAAQHGAHVMLVFAGLWGHCDRFGRFECKPRHLKLDILPFLEFDMADTIRVLEAAGFIQAYEVGSKRYGFIPSFAEHQRFGGKEASEPAKHPEPPVKSEGSNGEATVKQSPPLEWNKGMENGIREEEREGNGEDTREQVLASPEPEIEILPAPKAKKPERGTRWPADAIVPDDWQAAAADARDRAGLGPVDMRHEVVKFSHYWASPDARNPMKKDWKQTFINWILNSKGTANGPGKPTGQHGTTSAAGEIFGRLYANARARRETAGD